MKFDISQNLTKSALEDIYGGTIPDYHPDYFITSRLNDKFGLLAEMDGQPAGFLIYTVWWGNCPFIEILKVKEGCEGNGIGIALMRAAAREMKAKNFKILISSSEAGDPDGKKYPDGLGFHLKQGFKKLNTLHLPHGEEQFFSIELEKLL